MTDDIRYDGRAWHVALTIAGPMSENEIDGFAQHGYVGVLSEPAVFSRFIETTLSPPAVAIFDASMVLGNIDRLLRVDVITEAHWDYLHGEHGTVTDDIVRRLGYYWDTVPEGTELAQLLREAVTEIETLRTQVADLHRRGGEK